VSLIITGTWVFQKNAAKWEFEAFCPKQRNMKTMNKGGWVGMREINFTSRIPVASNGPNNTITSLPWWLNI